MPVGSIPGWKRKEGKGRRRRDEGKKGKGNGRGECLTFTGGIEDVQTLDNPGHGTAEVNFGTVSAILGRLATLIDNDRFKLGITLMASVCYNLQTSVV